MEGRKWDELPMDCLVDVLGRVGLESMLVDVPFVCQSWYKASLSPYCWKQLDFSDKSLFRDPFIIRFQREYRLQGRICMTKFLKVVVDRSGGCATTVKLPYYCKKEELTYVADKCPALKKLVLLSEDDSTMLALSLVIGKLKNMESLEIKSDTLFKDIVTKIGSHCEDFVSLSLDVSQPLSDFYNDEEETYIGEEEVSAIVSYLPKLKCLSLREVTIKRENLIKILMGCVELVHFEVRDCYGFDQDDPELLMLGSHIPTFECSVSVFELLLAKLCEFSEMIRSR